MDQQLTHGADSDRLRAIGDALVAISTRTREVEGDGSAQAAFLGAHWTGDDALTFQQSWSIARQRFTEAAEMLDLVAARARDQAAQQLAASGGAGAPGGGPSSPAPGPGRPSTPPPTASDLLDELEEMTPQERADYLDSDEFRDLALADPEGTKEAVDQAFDDGLFADDPTAYAEYLEQYWIDVSLAEAGIDPHEWDPSQGFEGNREIVNKVYEYYGQLYLDNPDLQWAAMANMIGPSFAGGFADLDLARDVARGIEAGSVVLPEPQRTLVHELASMSDEDFAFYEETLLSMQQEIFFDQGSMHQAYVDGGLDEIERMHAAGAIDDNALAAWQNIDSGDPDLVADGNHRLLWREQNQIIADDYQNMYNHPPTGPAVTYGITLIGEPTIPGARSFGEVFPVSVDVETAGPSDIPFTGYDNPFQGTVTVTTPLPDGNVADQSSRWALIEQDTWPAFTDLTQEEITQIVESDFGTRLQEARPSQNIDAIIARILSGFDVEVRQ